jgi:anaerobic selenocysteine-containing dehydrogenase
VSQYYNPPLQVVGFLGTQLRLNAEEARLRLIRDGELVWIYGPRRHELAPVVIDDTVPRGGVVVRDIAGLTVTEIVRLVKPNLDARPDRGAYA